MKSLPKKRGHILTEQRNPHSENLDRLSVGEIMELINNEDQTVPVAVRKCLPEIATFAEGVVRAFKAGGRLVYAGAGTSGRLGVLDASECPPTFSVPPDWVQGIIAGGRDALVRSVEGAEDYPASGEQDLQALQFSNDDVLLGIAAGGTTPYVHGALEYANRLGAFTGFLTCSSSDGDEELAGVLIRILTGPEVVTGSTRMKAGTATKLVLNMITTTAMIRMNKTYGNLMVDLKALNDKLWDRGSRIIEELTGLNYASSYKILKAADGEVKTALAMNLADLSAEEARTALKQAGGALREVIEGEQP